MIVAWDEEAWSQYLYLQKENKQLLRRVHLIITDIKRNGYTGLGKPEPLSGNLSGWWSRRLDNKNRIVYRIIENRLEIIQCGGHYSDR
jgi:toxin YoeB